MQLAAYISKFAANLSGSFGYVVTSKQWKVQIHKNKNAPSEST